MMFRVIKRVCISEIWSVSLCEMCSAERGECAYTYLCEACDAERARGERKRREQEERERGERKRREQEERERAHLGEAWRAECVQGHEEGGAQGGWGRL